MPISAPRLREWLLPYLVDNPNLSGNAKVLYLLSFEKAPDSIMELSRLSQLSRPTVHEAVRCLVKHGWMKLERTKGCLVPILSAPRTVQMELAGRLRDFRAMARLAGEFLMKALLDFEMVPVPSMSNARPAFLHTEETKDRLEYDLHVPPRHSWEYQGSQHFQRTSFTGDDTLEDIQRRDQIKAEISRKRGIICTQIFEEDLSIDGVLRKMPKSIKLLRFDREGPYAVMLSNLCEEYISSARKARQREKTRRANEGKVGRHGR